MGSMRKQIDKKTLSTVGSEIGRTANVIADEEEEQFATLYDLQKLMRHSDLKTMMAFYVSQDAGDTVERIWVDADSGDWKRQASERKKQVPIG